MGAPGVAYNPSYVSVDKIVDIVYPVGSIYISTSPVSPESLFNNFGSWERITDTFLLAASDTYKAGSTGGEATHTLTEAELPEISGSFGGTSSGNAWGVLGVQRRVQPVWLDSSADQHGKDRRQRTKYQNQHVVRQRSSA